MHEITPQLHVCKFNCSFLFMLLEQLPRWMCGCGRGRRFCPPSIGFCRLQSAQQALYIKYHGQLIPDLALFNWTGECSQGNLFGAEVKLRFRKISTVIVNGDENKFVPTYASDAHGFPSFLGVFHLCSWRWFDFTVSWLHEKVWYNWYFYCSIFCFTFSGHFDLYFIIFHINYWGSTWTMNASW